MKKNLFFYAALIASALSFGLVSCSVEDDPEIELDKTIKPTVIDDILAKPSAVTLPSTDQAPIEVELSTESPVSKIVIGSDNKALLYKANVQARAIVGSTNVFTGEYTIEGDCFVIVCEELGLNIKVPMDFLDDVTINDVSYKIEETLQIPTSATTADENICRTWTRPVYTAGVFFDKLPVYGVSDADKEEVADIKVLAKRIFDRIVAENSDLRDEGFDLLSSNIESLTFTANKVYLRFEDGRVEESTWEWTDLSKNLLKTVVDGKEVALEARFEAPDKAYFIVTANCEGVGGLGVHTLSGALICKMVESAAK